MGEDELDIQILAAATLDRLGFDPTTWPRFSYVIQESP